MNNEFVTNDMYIQAALKMARIEPTREEFKDGRLYCYYPASVEREVKAIHQSRLQGYIESLQAMKKHIDDMRLWNSITLKEGTNAK